MKRAIRNLILCFMLMGLYFGAFAQNSLSLSSNGSIVLNFTEPAEAGEPVEAVTDNSKWLNYDIAVCCTEVPVSISAGILSGSIPEGLQLELQAGPFNGTGGGNPGIPTGIIRLSNVSHVLISNIGTCNTGAGIHVGHQLSYTFSISDYSALRSSSSTVEILFTITQ